MESLRHGDSPSHEQHLPNYEQARARLNAFDQRRHTDTSLDLEAEIAALERDLTAIFQSR